MPATALNSLIFRDIFSTPEMRQVFSDEARTGYYLEIEAALARVQGKLGIIPENAMHEIVSKCRIENIDLDRLKQQTERIGYPILGVVQQIVGAVQGRPRRMVPLGRDHAGHHRHRRHPADPRRARTRRKGHGGDRRLARRPVTQAIATRRWPAAAICSRPCRSPSASRWRRCSPPCSATASGWRSCARACWSASSAARSATSRRSAPAASKCRRR